MTLPLVTASLSLGLQGGTLTQELSPTLHEQHVERTFRLSYDRLDTADPTDASALALLARAAYFAPGRPIPRDLLLTTVTWAPEEPDRALQAEDALRRLQDLGLLESDVAGTVRLHRLLAVFVRAVIRDTVAQTMVEKVLLTETNPLLSAGSSGPLLTLHPHLRAVTEAAQPREDVLTAHLGNALGRVLYLLGDYTGAQPYSQDALHLYERTLGPEHPETTSSLTNLAMVHWVLGHYATAESLCQRALTVREQTLGPMHPDVAMCLSNLALVYREQGRYAEAELLFQRAQTVFDHSLGPQHPYATNNLDNLAVLYEVQGRYTEAEPLYQRVLAIREQRLNPQHPDIAQSLNNVADVYCAQGRDADAEPFYQRALAIREYSLGPQHPYMDLREGSCDRTHLSLQSAKKIDFGDRRCSHFALSAITNIWER